MAAKSAARPGHRHRVSPQDPQGNFAYMVSNYADGNRRRFDSYAEEVDALAAADKLARRLDARDYVAASMTQEQALEYANAVERLKPFNVTVDAATATVAQCLKIVGDLANLHAASKFYAARQHYPDYLPCLAIGAFAGLRSAEIERLEWSDINLADTLIVVGASKSKTASRRIVPLQDNLAAWLAPYADRQGKVWQGSSVLFYKYQQAVAEATGVAADPRKNIAAQKPVPWKANGLRHSYASYRFALTNDAGRVAGELGNSAAVVHKHYRELVKPADAERWFGVKPEAPTNVLLIPAIVANAEA